MSKLTPHLPLGRRAAALAAIAAATALAAAPAGASVGSVVAAGPDGSAHFGYTQQAASASAQLHERTLAGGGALGPMQSVSWGYRNVVEHAIGVDSTGSAVMAWLSGDPEGYVAYARRRAADGSLSAIQRLSPAGVQVEDLRLAVEPDGDAIAVWSRVLSGKNVVQGRRRAANGTLGAIRTLSFTGGESYEPDVAVAPTGAATVAWVRATADDKFVQTRTLAPDDTLSAYKRLSAESEAAADPTVTVSDAGEAVFGWTRLVDEGLVLESRARTPGGTLGTVQTIAAPDQFSGTMIMAGNAAGRTVFGWTKYTGGGVSILKGRVREANGALGAVFDVDQAPVTDPQVAIDPAGNPTFAWQIDAGVDSIRARRRTAAGTLGVLRTLSDDDVHSTHPRLAVDAAGKATVAWFRTGGLWSARAVTAAGTVSAIHHLNAAP